MNFLSNGVDVLAESTLIKYPELLKEIRNRKYQVSDTNLTYRQINSLDDADLLPNTRESKKEWRKLSLNDLLYLHIVDKGREFNIGNVQLTQLKSLFYEQKIPFQFGDVSPSEIALIAMLVGIVPVGIIIFSDGTAVLSDEPHIAFRSHMSGKPSMFIAIYDTFRKQLEAFKDEDFAKKYDLEQFTDHYSPKTPNPKELAMLKFIRDEAVDSLELRKQNNGGLVMHVRFRFTDKAITEEKILEYMRKYDFADISIKKRAGDFVTFVIEDVYKL